MPQIEKKPSEAEMAQEARVKAEQATHRPEGETSEDEFKRANELVVEAKRAKMLGEIANIKEDIRNKEENIKNIESNPGRETVMLDRFRDEVVFMKKQLQEKETEYETWDKIERTGSPI